MRILVIAPEQLPVPPVVGGSVETCIHAATAKLAAMGYRLIIISRAHRLLPRFGRSAGGRIRHIRIGAKGRSGYLRAALKASRGHSFDLIQIENRPTFVGPVRRAYPKKPIVLSLHSQTFMFRLPRSKGNNALRLVDAVTAVGGKLRATLSRRHPRYRKKIYTAHPGVDTEKFRPLGAEARDRLRQKRGVSGSTNILFAGRIVPKKGLHTLVEAVSRVRAAKSVRLIVAGASWPGKRKETPYMRKVKRLAKRLGVRIVFTGYVPPSRMHQVYALADVFVCPTRYAEGFGLVNTEAMASGVPVIASRRGAIPEIIRHGKNGLLVRAYRSPAAFAKAIDRVLGNRLFAAKLAASGRRTAVERFSWSRTAEVYSRVYRRIGVR